MSHENKEQWKIWKGTELSIQNWHEEFGEFWTEHTKMSNICTLIDRFWKKQNVWAKKYTGVMFQGAEDWCEIWKKTDLCFQKWH